MARVFIAYVGGRISAIDLQRLAQAIDVAFARDLADLLHADEQLVRGNIPDATYLPCIRTLIPSGLAINNSQGVGVVKESNQITPLGHLLWEAWHYQLPVV